VSEAASENGPSQARRSRSQITRRSLPISRVGCLNSCSHTRTTFHPLNSRSCFTRRSRFLFRAIFGSQYSCRDFGGTKHFGHPCQKHPSTKIATRGRGKIKSGLPGSIELRRHPLNPELRIRMISAISVDLFPLERIAAIIRERVSEVTASATAVKLLGRAGDLKCPSNVSHRPVCVTDLLGLPSRILRGTAATLEGQSDTCSRCRPFRGQRTLIDSAEVLPIRWLCEGDAPFDYGLD